MADIKDFTERTVDSTMVFDGEILHVKKDNILLPNGKPATREKIQHIGAVCIVPVTDDGKIVMEEQYRYPISRMVYEIPAGKLDSSDEDRLLAAKRELREETGYEASEWIDLGIYLPAPAYSDEKITMYLARGLKKGSQDLDDDEFLKLSEAPIEEVVSKIFAGEIQDGKTQIAVLKAAKYLNKI